MSPPPSSPAESTEQARWFATEVQPHEAELRAYVRHRFPQIHDVDDLVQESFLRILRAKASGQIASAKAYLFATARNAAFAIFRRPQLFTGNPTADPGSLDIIQEGPTVTDQVSTRQEMALLLEAIDLLPSRCREIFILRKLQGLTTSEIATRLGLSPETVQVQLTRGAKRCVQYLRAHGVNRP